MFKKQVISTVIALSAGFATLPMAADAPGSVKAEEIVKKDFNDRLKETRIFVAQVTSENAEVLALFDKLSTNIAKAYTKEHALDDAEIDLILEGIEFATDRHKEQTRKNKAKTPYISHSLIVTLYLMEEGKVRDAKIITAALLHDTLRDGVASFDEIQKKFGKQISSYVQEMTENKEASRAERKRKQVIDAAHQSMGAAQIKLADQLCNLRELKSSAPEEWSKARIDEYYQWAQTVIDRLPAANPELKKAASQVIAEYWDAQDVASRKR